MSKDKYSYLDYIKQAFSWRFKVPLLGKMPLNILGLFGFGIMGFGHPAFWVLGLGMEVGYLFFLSGNERFQKVVLGNDLLHQQESWSQHQEKLLATLSEAQRKRYQNLLNFSKKIIGTIGSTGAGSEKVQHQGVGLLLWTFLQLLVSKEKIGAILSEETRNTIQKEIENLKKKLAQTQPETPLYRSIQGSCEIAEKRLETLRKAQENSLVVEAELERIEKQFALLHEEASISSDSELLFGKLDSAIQSLQNASQWLSDHREWFNSMDEPPVIFPPVNGQIKQGD